MFQTNNQIFLFPWYAKYLAYSLNFRLNVVDQTDIPMMCAWYSHYLPSGARDRLDPLHDSQKKTFYPIIAPLYPIML